MKVCIVGLGYVGLPLAVAASSQHEVVGFDINLQRVKELQQGVDKTNELDSLDLLEKSSLKFSNNSSDCVGMDIYIITVPTPVTDAKIPDLQPLEAAAKWVGRVLRKKGIVILESTVYPGCTEEILVPIIEKESNLEHNVDFFSGYSPERINPADKNRKLGDIVKVIAGSTKEITDKIQSFYDGFIDAGTFRATSILVAEAAKVIENAQRDINIAFVNELAMLFDAMDININDVLSASKTKWNFLDFHPGLVGGHCIGVDPYYLAYKAQQVGHYPEVLLSGRRVNESMVSYLASKIIKALNNLTASSDITILVMGVTFKEDCPDIRNSKSFGLIEELNDYGPNVLAFDPLLDAESSFNNLKTVEDISPNSIDCFVVTVAHSDFKSLNDDWFRHFGKDDYLIFDLKNCLTGVSGTLPL